MLTFLLQRWMDSRFRGNDGLAGLKTLRRDCPAPGVTELITMIAARIMSAGQ